MQGRTTTIARRTEFWDRGFLSMKYDRDELQALAFIMGLDFDAIEAEVKRREELSRIAWTCRQDPNWETTKAHYRYEEIGAHEGRQVFFNDWFGNYLVTGLEGGMKETTDPYEAMILLYRGD